MSRKADRPQRSRHILVYDEDWEFLHQMYGQGSRGQIGVGPAIRQMIHAWCKLVRAKAHQADSSSPASKSGLLPADLEGTEL